MDTTNSASEAELVWKVRRTCGTPGANMLEASGVRKTRTITSNKLNALAVVFQFLVTNGLLVNSYAALGNVRHLRAEGSVDHPDIPNRQYCHRNCLHLE